MWIRQVSVRHFAGIRSAELTLAHGLNVLYGPNEIGKSTLVEAIRAALLLQHGASAARDFDDWHTDQPAQVTLTLETEPQRIWRVRKSFGKGVDGSSYLDFSRDGETFTQEAKGRDVDGRIRELLRWGLPAPGGKGRSKGFSESFLATTLLADQRAVADLLQRSLDDDPRRIREGSAERRAAGARPRPGVPQGRRPHPGARGRGIHRHRATQPTPRIAMDEPARPASGCRPAPRGDSRPRYRERRRPRPRRPLPRAARRGRQQTRHRSSPTQGCRRGLGSTASQRRGQGRNRQCGARTRPNSGASPRPGQGPTGTCRGAGVGRRGREGRGRGRRGGTAPTRLPRDLPTAFGRVGE